MEWSEGAEVVEMASSQCSKQRREEQSRAEQSSRWTKAAKCRDWADTQTDGG